MEETPSPVNRFMRRSLVDEKWSPLFCTLRESISLVRRVPEPQKWHPLLLETF